jgi:hypothetical protein
LGVEGRRTQTPLALFELVFVQMVLMEIGAGDAARLTPFEERQEPLIVETEGLRLPANVDPISSEALVQIVDGGP